MKHYRFAASVLLTTIGYLLGHIYADKRLVQLTWWHEVVLVIIVYAVICWFVNIDADAAEGIAISFFKEHSAVNDYQRMNYAQQVTSMLFRNLDTKSRPEPTEKPKQKMDTVDVICIES